MGHCCRTPVSHAAPNQSAQEYERQTAEAVGHKIPPQQPASKSRYSVLVNFWLARTDRQRARILKIESTVEVDLVRRTLSLGEGTSCEGDLLDEASAEKVVSIVLDATGALGHVVKWASLLRYCPEEECIRGRGREAFTTSLARCASQLLACQGPLAALAHPKDRFRSSPARPMLYALDGGRFFLFLLKLASRGRILAGIEKETVFEGPDEIISLIFDRRIRHAFAHGGHGIPAMISGTPMAMNQSQCRAKRALRQRQEKKSVAKMEESKILQRWFHDLPPSSQAPLLRLQAADVPASVAMTVAECQRQQGIRPHMLSFEIGARKLDCTLQFPVGHRVSRIVEHGTFDIQVAMELSAVFLEVIFHADIVANQTPSVRTSTASCLPDLCGAFRRQLQRARKANLERDAMAACDFLLKANSQATEPRKKIQPLTSKQRSAHSLPAQAEPSSLLSSADSHRCLARKEALVNLKEFHTDLASSRSSFLKAADSRKDAEAIPCTTELSLPPDNTDGPTGLQDEPDTGDSGGWIVVQSTRRHHRHHAVKNSRHPGNIGATIAERVRSGIPSPPPTPKKPTRVSGAFVSPVFRRQSIAHHSGTNKQSGDAISIKQAPPKAQGPAPLAPWAGVLGLTTTAETAGASTRVSAPQPNPCDDSAVSFVNSSAIELEARPDRTKAVQTEGSGRISDSFPTAHLSTHPDTSTVMACPYVTDPCSGTSLQLALVEGVRHQINYYFSHGNLAKDAYLLGLMDAWGCVPLDVILSFPRMEALLRTIAPDERVPFVAGCLYTDPSSKYGPVLAVSGDTALACRVVPHLTSRCSCPSRVHQCRFPALCAAPGPTQRSLRAQWAAVHTHWAWSVGAVPVSGFGELARVT